MDEDRKYRQRGYQDYGSEKREDRPRPKGPRPPLDVTGPRLPRLVQAVAASRCYNCAVTLPPDTDFAGECPKCHVALHCCKQCTHFDPSTRFQCRQPIPERIASKDKPNECGWFSPKVTVARDSAQVASLAPRPDTNSNPRSPQDARTMFDNLFKK
jgi:hypothetical protein